LGFSQIWTTPPSGTLSLFFSDPGQALVILQTQDFPADPAANKNSPNKFCLESQKT
jgi:hypothetical protein